MWRRWGCAAAILLVLSASPATATRLSPGVYAVDAVEARWTAVQRNGELRVWSIRAARYEDPSTGSVVAFARITSQRGDAPAVTIAAGEPDVFAFAPDLSGAEVVLGRHRAEWTASDPAGDALAAAPYPYSRDAECGDGAGRAAGVFREAFARGSVAGREVLPVGGDKAFVGRFVLGGDCDPAEWWAPDPRA